MAAGLADVLIELLQLEFVFVRLCVPGAVNAVDVMRGTAWETFPAWLESHLSESGRFSGIEIIPDVDGGPGPCRGIAIPIGVNAEGGVVSRPVIAWAFPRRSTSSSSVWLRIRCDGLSERHPDPRAHQGRSGAPQDPGRAGDHGGRADRRVAAKRGLPPEAQRLTHTGTAALDGVLPEITHSSDQHARLYGFDPERGFPLSKNSGQRVHPEDRAGWTEALKRNQRSRKRQRGFPGRSSRRASSSTSTQSRIPSSPRPGELGELMATVVDVTDRGGA